MTDTEVSLRAILESAYALMETRPGKGPGPLGKFLDLAIQAATDGSDAEKSASVRREMLSTDPNNSVRGLFGQMLRAWDFAGSGVWVGETRQNSPERRALAYRLLGLSDDEILRADQLVPFADMRNSNIVVAEDHVEWYKGERRTAGFYWKEYRRYLEQSNWNADSLNDLSEGSDLILERLSDPFRPECRPTKGLVVGYVQSGKTANFTAVVAKAADAGYRLIIIFGGVLDILRSQTQRRLDKELIGQEIIAAEPTDGAPHEYLADSDWKSFVQHGALPSQLGHFNFERLTGIRDDYKSSGRHFSALEFRGRYEDRPFNHPDNLRNSPVRLVVLKKHPSRIKALRKDLQRLRNTALDQIPTLIIDDESDQASINAANPKKQPPGTKKRNPTNREIVELIRLLPRAQYVGYTATPFANVFIDPTDVEDIFPRDFMVALKRPAGYMGVRDFYDFDSDGRPLTDHERPPGFQSNERAFLRDIRKGEKESAENMDVRTLLQAVDSFVLSGAVKLFRADRGISIKLRHHTMLVHRSTARTSHLADQMLVKSVFDLARYDSREASDRLKALWETDFTPVALAKSGGLSIPESFADLAPYIEQALRRIRRYGGEVGPVRVVNAEPGLAEQVPDFDREDVWSILVGGAKLSRGFTVEGLTVSYFRRTTRTADTLMQTGRWFGFRQGYHDVVRVFFGREEPAGRDATYDLQEAFKAICLDEEVFRGQLRRYVERREGVPPITPKQIPPLVPMHLLQPTATNKMYNAVVKFLNFGEEWKESTPQPADGPLVKENAQIFGDLLKTLRFESLELGVTDPDDSTQQIRWRGLVASADPAVVRGVLDRLKWVKDLEGYADERRFLHSSGDLDPGIDHWLIVAPQQDGPAPTWQCGQSFKIVERGRRTDSKGNERYGVYSERRHRLVAEAISKVREFSGLTGDTEKLRADRTAVLMFYPTVEKGTTKKLGGRGKVNQLADEAVTMGFGMQFPKNEIKRLVVFGVRNENRPEDVVVTDDRTS